MSQKLGALAALAEDLALFPSTRIPHRGSQPPVTSAPEDDLFLSFVLLVNFLLLCTAGGIREWKVCCFQCSMHLLLNMEPLAHESIIIQKHTLL